MMDVVLRRNGVTRRWTITKWAKGWSFRYIDDDLVSFGGCDTLEAALAQKRAWEAEIIAALANGWTDG